jgi:hypothetical protein
MEQTLVKVANQPRTVSVATDLGREKPTKSVQKVDLIGGKQLVKQVAEILNNRYVEDEPALDFFKRQVSLLTREDLVAALDEVAAQNFHVISRYTIYQDLLHALGEIDPELSLNRCGDLWLKGEPNLADCLTGTLREWGMKDPQLAGAWLDQQTATGKYNSKRLDDKDSLRDILEATLIDALLVKNNAVAEVRLKSLSKESRDAVALKLSNTYWTKTTEPGSLEYFLHAYGEQSSHLVRDCYEIMKGTDPAK